MNTVIESFLIAVIAMVIALSIKLWWRYYELDELITIFKPGTKKSILNWKAFGILTLLIVALCELVYWIFVA